jgi:uncharacterized protein YejL (UPF0352 family)
MRKIERHHFKMALISKYLDEKANEIKADLIIILSFEFFRISYEL